MTSRRARKSAAPISIRDLASRVRVPVTEQTMLSTLAGRFAINAIRRSYRLFDGDLTLFLVFGEIAQYNVSRAIKALDLPDDPDSLRLKDMMRSLLEEKIAPCNALSISAATGIPRETVRGKVKLLEQRGWIVREGARRLTLAPDGVEHMRPLERESVDDLRETARLTRLVEDAYALKKKQRAARAGSKPSPRSLDVSD
jgi:predicted transcriptional regulator